MGDSIMASLIPSGSASGTGSVTLTVPTTNNNQTATLPDATGTVMVSGNMPAFSAYPNAVTSLANNAYTKILFQVKDFDTNSCFSSSTFTPNVAGYYLITCTVGVSLGAGQNLIALYKNGIRIKIAQDSPSATYALSGSWIVYCNGSTDYIEIYVYQNSGGSVNTSATSIDTWIQGAMIRAA